MRRTICGVTRVAVLAVVLAVLQLKYDVGLGGRLLVAVSCLIWAISAYIESE